jgi:hypothetical protein
MTGRAKNYRPATEVTQKRDPGLGHGLNRGPRVPVDLPSNRQIPSLGCGLPPRWSAAALL